MTKTTCLVLDKSDYTRDGNLKSDVFEAIITSDVVVHNDRVVKNNLRSTEPAPQGFLPLDSRPEPDTGCGMEDPCISITPSGI
jgi:hypothetical protein